MIDPGAAAHVERLRVPLRSGDEDTALSSIFAEVESAVGAIPNLYRAIGNSPLLLRSWIDYAWSLRADPEVDRGLRELLILRVAQRTACDYVWRSHWRPARQAGYSSETLLAIGAWSTSPDFTPTERAALALTDGLIAGARADDEAWTNSVATFGHVQTLELVLTVAWYLGVVRVASTLEVPLETGHDRAPPVPGEATRSPTDASPDPA